MGLAAAGAAGGLVEFAKELAVLGQPATASDPGPLNGLIGVLALAGVALLWTRLPAAALVLATAGLAAITADALGSPPPRVLPGAVLVIAAAVALAAETVDHDPTPVTFTWARLVVWMGLGLHLVMGIPLIAVGLVAPGWAVTAMWAVWGALLFFTLRLRRTRPWPVLITPPTTAVFLVGALWFGERLLGWSP